ncbi:aminopeptidase P family protein [Neorickettsia helminthoeca]|nr:aminopeptidase P family protein [Neorickettsia helminthoeca]
MEERLIALRSVMRKLGLKAFLIPINDEFLLEYPLASNNRLAWLTGFTGSFAMVIVTQEKVYFFTDSRYLIQAKNELHEHYTILDAGHTSILLAIRGDNIEEIGYDPKLLTEETLKLFPCTMIPVNENPIDLIWERDTPIKSEVRSHDIRYAGLSSKEKCSAVLDAIGQNRYFFSNSESVCWLANIRGSDLDCIPVLCCRGILYPNGLLKVFTHCKFEKSPFLEAHIEILSLDDLEIYLASLDSVLLDERNTSVYYLSLIGEEKIIHMTDPSVLLRACKNDTEINGAISAHKRDAIAFMGFLDWLKNNQDTSEIEAEKVLLKFRKEQDLFYSASFPTISAFGANGAIVHYHATEKSNLNFESGNLYLCDSGAQYLDGTTDITRTIAIGKPTEEQCFHYTLVLKAHISLAMVIFPVGTTGKQLDAIARSKLWKYKLDYGHSTGHGVGSFLNVHEGPHSFGNNVPLQPGMIISNEPGLYFEGKYGIRIENLMYVTGLGDGFLGFRQLTLVPFEEKLILSNMLSNEESAWLEEYSDSIKAVRSDIFSSAIN